MVAESADLTRVTEEPRDKLALCSAPAPASPASAHRPGEKFHTLVSSSAVDAYQARGVLPEDASVVKRTFLASTGDVTAYFVMFKDPGAKASGGWVYATTDAAGIPLRAGELADCLGCHRNESVHDFLFGMH